MPIIDPRNMLSELWAGQAMRRFAINIPQEIPVEQTIRCMIKYKINAILVCDARLEPVGVVSKTDLVSAYYASIPISAPCSIIMTSPPIFCTPEDSLERVLNSMRVHGIHRVYVRGDAPGQPTGVVSYSDIVGLLYRYCHKCDKSILGHRHGQEDPSAVERLKVREAMTPSVRMHDVNTTLTQIMEGLSAQTLGAVLITGEGKAPVGVVSKTDLILAYRHGRPTSTPARAIMRAPVVSCDQEEDLARAIKKMIFSDIHRLLVYKKTPENIVGVLTLSDAARARSGSCRACMPSRISIEGG